MERGEHSSRELTVSIKAPCQECGGRGYIETVEGGHIVGDTETKCLTCNGRGAIPTDMPLSEFRELLKTTFASRFARRS
jgi:DnaJ-class molecular chaperone